MNGGIYTLPLQNIKKVNWSFRVLFNIIESCCFHELKKKFTLIMAYSFGKFNILQFSLAVQ